VRRRLPAAAVVLSCAGLALLAAAGAGTRLGLWHFRTGFALLQWGAYAGLAGAAAGAAALVLRAGPAAPAAALLLGLTAAAVPWLQRRSARSFPPIHDVSTDLESPPPFAAVLPLRAGAPNPPEHGGPEVAAQQRQAYPELGPALLDAPAAEALERARRAAEALGWRIVDVDAAAGRLEATDTTFWFGFKDDVVVRVTPAAGGSRVDARSVSRVGKGDAGANARRLRRFLARLSA
jgi:uncharacterized protein (DUF1499 family)